MKLLPTDLGTLIFLTSCTPEFLPPENLMSSEESEGAKLPPVGLP